MEFDLRGALEWGERHQAAHPEPVEGRQSCALPLLVREVKAEPDQTLGRTPTRAEVAAHPKMLTWDAQRKYELMVMAAQFGVQPKG
jgi:hypothetical protein